MLHLKVHPGNQPLYALKKTAKCFLILYLVALAPLVSIASPLTPEHRLPTDLIIGHRGSGQKNPIIPENSISSLIRALTNGANAVEFDIQLTADGEVVLAHNETLEGFTDGKGCVSQMTLEQLRKLHLKDGSGKVHPDMSIASFKEALSAITPFDQANIPFIADVHVKVYAGLKYDLDLKSPLRCPTTDAAKLTQTMLKTIHEMGLLNRLLITSFDYHVLDLVKEDSPTLKTGYLACMRPGHALEMAVQKQYSAVVLNQGHVSPDEVELAHKNGLAVYIWTTMETSKMETLILRKKVDGFITDSIVNALTANRWAEDMALKSPTRFTN